MPVLNQGLDTFEGLNVYRNRLALVGAEKDLYELACLSGILVDEEVFKIVIDLLRMQVSPTAIVRMLRGISSTRTTRSNTDVSHHSKDGKPKKTKSIT